MEIEDIVVVWRPQATRSLRQFILKNHERMYMGSPPPDLLGLFVVGKGFIVGKGFDIRLLFPK